MGKFDSLYFIRHMARLKEKDTLVSLIIVQVGIKVQVGKISKINKRADWNIISKGILVYLIIL